MLAALAVRRRNRERAGVHGTHRRHGAGQHRRRAARRDGRGHRTAEADRGHRRAGAGAPAQPAGRHLSGQGVAPGVRRLPESHRPGRRRQRRPAARHARRAGRERTGAGRRATRRSSSRSARRSPPTSPTRSCRTFPSARDPWVVLQTMPGVIVDRVNVGGSESGQQSNYVAKGATTGDNTWYMDGIPITDMSALGSSPSYYDFDMFQEMQVTTGGADARQATPGVQMNFVLKSGTNTPHGSARTYYENKDLQGNNLPDGSRRGARRRQRQGQPPDQVRRLRRRARRPDREGPAVGVGLVRPHRRRHPDARRLPGQDDARGHRREDAGGVHPGVARQLHLLLRQQEEGRPRRRPVQSARDDVHPGRAVEDVQGRGQRRRCRTRCS